MLSGFVLARAYGPGVVSGRLTLSRFWLKRFARSYPTHLITLAILALLVFEAFLVGEPRSTSSASSGPAFPPRSSCCTPSASAAANGTFA